MIVFARRSGYCAALFHTEKGENHAGGGIGKRIYSFGGNDTSGGTNQGRIAEKGRGC